MQSVLHIGEDFKTLELLVCGFAFLSISKKMLQAITMTQTAKAPYCSNGDLGSILVRGRFPIPPHPFVPLISCNTLKLMSE